MFESVLIANRGEIAVRIIRACHELGIRTIAVYSDADVTGLHVALADEAYALGPAPANESYLDVEQIIGIAQQANAETIHPGYGFLAENADFANAVHAAGVTFVGPSPSAIQQMGDKLSARQTARDANVPVVPGTTRPVTSIDDALAFGVDYGYPLTIKAIHGGGGRGLKVIHDAAQMPDSLESAQREASEAFGHSDCYLEQHLQNPRHIEVQIIGDANGTVRHLGDRDCSLQRRHQKLVEEAPAPDLHPQVRAAITDAAIRIAQHVAYTNAGTCEFLLDADGKTFYFLEMNTRLQVEHPITELVTGIDLVQTQLQIAAGEAIQFTQADIRSHGHAIEARINTEDPHQDFVPTPGTIRNFEPPLGPWVRFDSAVRSGDDVSPYYDSLIGKLAVWGPTRAAARARMIRALNELTITGTATTIPFHKLAIAHRQFITNTHSTRSVETEWDLASLPEHNEYEADPDSTPHLPRPTSARGVELTIGGQTTHITVYGTASCDTTPPAGTLQQSSRPNRTHDRPNASPDLKAPMHGIITTCAINDGATVREGDVVCVLEAMKMEHHIVATRDGIIDFAYTPGEAVEKDTVLATIK